MKNIDKLYKFVKSADVDESLSKEIDNIKNCLLTDNALVNNRVAKLEHKLNTLYYNLYKGKDICNKSVNNVNTKDDYKTTYKCPSCSTILKMTDLQYEVKTKEYYCKHCDFELYIPYLNAIADEVFTSADKTEISYIMEYKDIFKRHISKIMADSKATDDFHSKFSSHIATLEKYISHYHIPKNLTVINIRKILKIAKLTNLNEYSSVILKEKCNVQIPKVAEDDLRNLEGKFVEINLRYDKIHPLENVVSRKYYPYLIKKIIEMFFNKNNSLMQLITLIHIPNKRSIDNIDSIWGKLFKV